ncbi:MAG: AMED_5909 family protein [Sciscionella sp.]
MTKSSKPLPTKLADVIVFLAGPWPSANAPAEVWQAHHQHRAAAYAHAAEHDADHKHEARYMATMEQAKADFFRDQAQQNAQHNEHGHAQEN